MNSKTSLPTRTNLLVRDGAAGLTRPSRERRHRSRKELFGISIRHSKTPDPAELPLFREGGHGSVFVRLSYLSRSRPTLAGIWLLTIHILGQSERGFDLPPLLRAKARESKHDARSPEDPIAPALRSAHYSTFSIVCDSIRAGSN